MDASFVYGSQKEITNTIRSYKNGWYKLSFKILDIK